MSEPNAELQALLDAEIPVVVGPILREGDAATIAIGGSSGEYANRQRLVALVESGSRTGYPVTIAETSQLIHSAAIGVAMRAVRVRSATR